MSITIRPIREQDFPQLIALFQEFAHFQKTPERMTNTVELMKAEKDFCKGFVAENEQGQIVGYASYFFTYHTWVGKSIYMDDLYVTQSYRKAGLGKQLMERVITAGKETNCHRMRWLVSDWNVNAQEFYLKMGASLDHTEMHCELIL